MEKKAARSLDNCGDTIKQPLSNHNYCLAAKKSERREELFKKL